MASSFADVMSIPIFSPRRLSYGRLKGIFTGVPAERCFQPVAEWLAAVHDIGKVTPEFIQKIDSAVNGNIYAGDKENHAAASWQILKERFGEPFATIAGLHHGRGLPNAYAVNLEQWHDLRKRIVDSLQKELRLPEWSSALAEPLKSSMSAPILGALILADWISSGMDLPPGATVTQSAAANAVANAGFRPFTLKKGLSFSDLFGFRRVRSKGF